MDNALTPQVVYYRLVECIQTRYKIYVCTNTNFMPLTCFQVASGNGWFESVKLKLFKTEPLKKFET